MFTNTYNFEDYSCFSKFLSNFLLCSISKKLFSSEFENYKNRVILRDSTHLLQLPKYPQNIKFLTSSKLLSSFRLFIWMKSRQQKPKTRTCFGRYITHTSVRSVKWPGHFYTPEYQLASIF